MNNIRSIEFIPLKQAMERDDGIFFIRAEKEDIDNFDNGYCVIKEGTQFLLRESEVVVFIRKVTK